MTAVEALQLLVIATVCVGFALGFLSAVIIVIRIEERRDMVQLVVKETTTYNGAVVGVTVIGKQLDRSFRNYQLPMEGWWENGENRNAYHYLIPRGRLGEALKQGAERWTRKHRYHASKLNG